MPKKSFKETMVAKLAKRINAIDAKLSGYHELVMEKQELLSAIAAFESNPLPTPQPQPASNGGSLGSSSVEALNVLGRLPTTFTLEDITQQLNGHRDTAYKFVAEWKRSNRIISAGRGCYQKVPPSTSKL